MSELVSILISMALFNNIVLFQFLGLCPVFSAYSKPGLSIRIGLTVSLVILVSSIVSWLSYNYVLAPLNAEYLYLLVYLLIISLVVQGITLFLKRTNKRLNDVFGINALFIVNCAVLGAILINTYNSYTLMESIVSAIGAGIGFTIIMALMSGIYERLEITNVPKAMKGLPIVFITVALLAISFNGFIGL
jgi:electron transport complex protein RnfA